MSAPTPLPPGWYPDPSGKAGKLYWDGQEWHTAPPPVPVPPSAQKKPGCLPGLALFVVLFAVLAGLLGTCGHSSNTSSTTTPTTYSEQENEQAVIEICHDAVKKDLRDPDSAKFGDDWKAWPVTHYDKPPSVSYYPEQGDKLYSAGGSVNAKNGFGGYVGDQPYGCDAAVETNGKIRAHAYSLADILNPTATP
jgi:hypothetical protein